MAGLQHRAPRHIWNRYSIIDDNEVLKKYASNEQVLAEASDKKYRFHAVFSDASKAFDVEWHASLLQKLHGPGIK